MSSFEPKSSNPLVILIIYKVEEKIILPQLRPDKQYPCPRSYRLRDKQLLIFPHRFDEEVAQALNAKYYI